MGNSSSASRLNAIYILLILKNHSDAEHPLSITEITEKVNTEFYHSISDESSINASTVSRILDAICLDINLGFQNIPIDFYDDCSNLGFNIYCVMEGPNGTWKYYEAPDTGRPPKKYYYYESIFTNAELTTLIDSVETYNYFSTDDISGLVAKLLGLRPVSAYLDKYNKTESSRLKDEDSLVLANIDDLNHLIKNHQFAEITYCNYNSEQELVPRENYPRIIRPLSMMWSNGYYYLVALFAAGYTPANLRIDRITDIRPVTPTPQMLKEFRADVSLDSSVYRMKHPVMYGGKIQHITMLYLDSPTSGMNNAIMDTFGKLTQIRPATNEEIQKHIGAYSPKIDEPFSWMRADFQSTIGGTKLFATQYCNYCKIIAPTAMRDSIAGTLTAGLSLYETK